jgi:hypothetical protein
VKTSNGSLSNNGTESCPLHGYVAIGLSAYGCHFSANSLTLPITIGPDDKHRATANLTLQISLYLLLVIASLVFHRSIEKIAGIARVPIAVLSTEVLLGYMARDRCHNELRLAWIIRERKVLDKGTL